MNDVFEGTNGAQWWTISDIPMLRMNFNPSTISAVTDVNKQSLMFTLTHQMVSL